MKRTLLLVLLGVVLLSLCGCNSATQNPATTTAQVIPEKRPFITKWKGMAGQTIEFPIIGMYTLTWYNETTPNDRHTEQVSVSVKIDKDGLELVAPYVFTPPTDGVYVVEAGPEGVEGIVPYSSDAKGRLLTEVAQFGDVRWRRLAHAFQNCKNMHFAAGIDTPDLSQCTSLAGMFAGCETFNALLEDWDVSHITDLSGMFLGCARFNSPLAAWNVSQVENMGSMFHTCSSFNQPLGGWNVSRVKNMEQMFFQCYEFNQPLAQWNVGQVTQMNSMFEGCLAFNQPLEAWDISHVTTTNGMFGNCQDFNQPLAGWDVSQVQDMKGMFADCKVFNQPLAGWNVSKVRDMSYMFCRCISFNQSLERWDVSNVTEMGYIFLFCPAGKLPFTEQWKTQGANLNTEAEEKKVLEEEGV